MVILSSGAGLGLTTPPKAADWSGTISQNTSTLYAFTTARIVYTFTSTGTQGWTSIMHFKVYFDWMPSGIYYGLGPVDPIPDGGSANFYLNLTVPNAVGSHTQTINVTTMAEGDPVSTARNYTATIRIVSIPPLQLSIAANRSTGQAPLSVSFTSTLTGGLGTVWYYWTFGDGGISTSANPSHTYQSSGTYTVAVLAMDAYGNQKTATTTVSVTAVATGGGGVAPEGGLIVFGIIALVVVIAAVAVVALRLRRPSPPTQPPSPPAPPR